LYGPHILGLSVCSGALETSNGGAPVIAIHGTNRPGLIDGAHSNGCVRVTNDIVTQLKDMLPAGTPVQIVQTKPLLSTEVVVRRDAFGHGSSPQQIGVLCHRTQLLRLKAYLGYWGHGAVFAARMFRAAQSG